MSNAVLNRERKAKMIEKTKEYFGTYNNYMILNIEKVKAIQFSNIMRELPSGFKTLFAKNKILKMVLKELDAEKYKELIDSVKGNVLLLFFDGVSPREAYTVSRKHFRAAPAVAGNIATKNIVIPAGPTGLAPEKISIFQAAKINTKINKGKIDLISDHVLVPEGQPVGISDANLLNLLGIMPFEFSMEIEKVFENGEIYTKNILLIDEECIEQLMKETVASVAAFSLGAGFVSEASIPYEINAAYKECEQMLLGVGIKLDN